MHDEQQSSEPTPAPTPNRRTRRSPSNPDRAKKGETMIADMRLRVFSLVLEPLTGWQRWLQKRHNVPLHARRVVLTGLRSGISVEAFTLDYDLAVIWTVVTLWRRFVKQRAAAGVRHGTSITFHRAGETLDVNVIVHVTPSGVVVASEPSTLRDTGFDDPPTLREVAP